MPLVYQGMRMTRLKHVATVEPRCTADLLHHNGLRYLQVSHDLPQFLFVQDVEELRLQHVHRLLHSDVRLLGWRVRLRCGSAAVQAEAGACTPVSSCSALSET